MRRNSKEIDILCVGESLIDFIGSQKGLLINNIEKYHRYLGGSPTNVIINSAMMGLNTKLISTIGNDGFGKFIFKKLSTNGVNTNHIKNINHKPTTVIFISRSENTPDFLPYRGADNFISEDQILPNTLLKTNIFHTTCFALSKTPAQSTILKKAKEAYDLGCQLSIDMNYSNKVWDSNENAKNIIRSYCKFNPLVKASGDDMYRFFKKHLKHEKIFDFFHSNGANTVCLTLGSKGVKLSQKQKEVIELPAMKVEKIMDTTGAGDAFWSGFLYAYIKKKNIRNCLKIALQLAALKLKGELSDNLSTLPYLK